MNERTAATNDGTAEMDGAMTLDGNAVAGLLQEIFGADLTAQPCECAHCGNRSEAGSLRAFSQGPGITLRCSICAGVMIRIVQTPGSTHLDLQGTAWLRIKRPTV